MKYILTLVLFSLKLLQAESFDISIGSYSTGSKGTLAYTQIDETWNVVGEGSDTLDYDKQNQIYISSDFKIDYPYYPHIKADYLEVTTNGNSQKSIELAGNDVSVSASSELTLIFVDISPYYSILDYENIPRVDIGITLRHLSYEYNIGAENINFLSNIPDYTESGHVLLPMLYTRVEYIVPIINVKFSADSKFMMTNNSVFYDYRIQADFKIELNEVLSSIFEIGYRAQRYKLSEEDVENINTDIKYSGPYLGLGLHF